MSDQTVAGMSARHVTVPADVEPVTVLGTSDQVLRAMERGFPLVRFVVVGREVRLSGPQAEVDLAAQLVEELVRLARTGSALDAQTVEHAVALLRDANREVDVSPGETLAVSGRTIVPKTPGQRAYVRAMHDATITFGIGPAGTGKTYLAVAEAVASLLGGDVRRIVLTRPAVEAGENLGFLPGTLTDKIEPYLRPLYDALHDMLDADALPKLVASGTIEVAPLAYMRGRTLNDSFVILDEAQNTTSSQMKMFLTRLGFNSRVVVTGDVSQVDLPGSQSSGLKSVEDILAGIDDVAFCYLDSADVARHHLVGEIIDAYSRWDARRARERGGTQGRGR